MNKRKTLLFLCLVLFFQAGTFVSKATAAEKDAKPLTNCDIERGPCTEIRDGLQVTLDILPKPVKAMKELTFRLSFSGGKLIDNPYIDLSMPGMDMGPNRVMLKRVGDSGYEGRGVVVKCPSGRRTWKATVTLQSAQVVEFVFDVTD
jgi:hypothetical protein